MKIQNDPKAQKTALLVTCAAILQMAESFFPQPVPGIKLGLANMITIVALVDLGFVSAMEIAVLRTIVSSLLLGTFLTPTFMLSFSSAITSSLAMGAAYAVISRMKHPIISLVGISIIGAVVHNLTQISLVYLLIIKNAGVFMLLPWLGISGVIMGWVTGIIASKVCEKLEDGSGLGQEGYDIKLNANPGEGKNFNKRYLPGGSFLHVLPAEFKIISVVAMAVAIFALNNLYSYTVLLCLVLITAMAAGIPFKDAFGGVKKMASFILFSFALPLFFNAGGHVLWALGPIKITQTGLNTGALFAFRLVLLMLSTDLMIRTTKSENLLKGIETILKPLKFAGISGSRASSIIVTSWMSVPEFWDKAMVLVKKFRKEENKGMKNAVAVVSSVIVSLYRQTEI